jgi:hypothetical protein
VGIKGSIQPGDNLLEMFTGDLSLGSEILVQENEDGGDDTEKSAKTKHDEVSNSLREWGLISKEGVLSLVYEEGWKVVIEFCHF